MSKGDKILGTNLKNLNFNEIGQVARTPSKKVAMLIVEAAIAKEEYVVIEAPNGGDNRDYVIQLHESREETNDPSTTESDH